MIIRRSILAALACSAFSTPTVASADPITVAVFGSAFAATLGGAVVTAVITAALTTLGSLALTKLFGPSQRAQDRQASIASLSIGENPREALFGEVATGGTLADAFNYGGTNATDWEVLIITVADHRCHSLTGFYVSDKYVPFTGDGPVTGYNGQLEVYWLPGTETQAMPSVVTSYGGWGANDNLAGCAIVVVAYKIDSPKAKNPIWTAGRPSFLWVVKGKHCYIPRLDSTVEGGSGSHRWDDPDTWQWTDNVIDCRYNWQRGIYACDRIEQPGMLLVGRGLSAIEAPPERTIASANVCDELVELKAGGTEKRYRCNAVVRADEEFIATEEMFAAACAGIIVQREGGVEVEPGAARSVVAEITDADLVIGEKVTFNQFRTDTQRVNSVVPRYVEPLQKWADHAAPIRRDLADLAIDGGPREETLALSAVTSGTQAQRCGEIRRRAARLERSGGFTLGPRFVFLEDGDWIGWTSQRHLKGERVVFRIDRYTLPSSWRNSMTFEEIASEVFDWDADADEITPGAVAEQQTPPPIDEDPDLADWAAVPFVIADTAQLVIRVTGAVLDPAVAAVIIEHRIDDGADPLLATDWLMDGTFTGDLDAFQADIMSVSPDADYNVSIRFAFFAGGLSDRLIINATTDGVEIIYDGQVPL